MSHILEDLKLFLNNSPTSWHAVQEIGNRLALVDFTPLEEGERWELKSGGKYFVQKGGSLCAFVLPEGKPNKIKLLASHTDSPALKLKPKPEVVVDGMLLLETEVYGSPLLSSWLNRDLALAGRVIIQREGKIEEKLVFLDEFPLFIPQLPIHLDRDVNEKGLLLDKETALRPILGLQGEKKIDLITLIKHQTSFDKLLSFDLFLVPLEPANFLGLSGEMLAAYRLDNLASAHACTAAIASSFPSKALQMALFWDHEEIGSRTHEGAHSPLLADTLRRISLATDITEEELLRMKSASLCLSVDVAHAFNPNYPLKFDPAHKPLIGKGVVIKHNAGKKYATDAKGEAAIIAACESLSLPYQTYLSRASIPCGSTVGPIVSASFGLPTVDIGAPIFSMHSVREVMGSQDHLTLTQLLTHLLQS